MAFHIIVLRYLYCCWWWWGGGVLHRDNCWHCGEHVKPHGMLENAQLVAYGAVETSKSLRASCIIAITKTGLIAEYLSSYRPHIPVLCLVPNEKVGRMIQIRRGAFYVYVGIVIRYIGYTINATTNPSKTINQDCTR